MAVFVFNALQGNTTQFNSSADSIIFSAFDGDATDFTFFEDVVDSISTVHIFKNSDWPAILAGNISLIARLTGPANTDLQLANFTSSNFNFFGSGTIVFGDNSVLAPSVGSTDAVFDNLAQTINGTINNDQIHGLGGNDVISTGLGDDFVNGNKGDDSIDGGTGSDFLLGGADNDTIIGSSGHDTINGNKGNDILSASAGNNNMNGNEGNDTITGGAGDDMLRGGKDDDVINSIAGNDTVMGDLGNDILTLSAAAGQTVIARGGSGNDTINGSLSDASAVLDINGNEGDDSIVGGIGVDALRGGQGNDTVEGGNGNDTLYGDKDNDVVFGEEGDDLIYGGAGNDTLVGNTGDDTLLGEDGDDVIRVVSPDFLTEANIVNGGSGSDILVFDGAPAAVNVTFANVSGIDIIESPGGAAVFVFDDTVLSLSDLGQIEFRISDTTSVRVDTSALSTDFDLILSAPTGGFFLEDNAGNRVLTSELGTNIIGGSGVDTIIGGEAEDEFLSGAGADLLTGGQGGDIFLFIAGSSDSANGVDIITDFDSASDSIKVAGFVADSNEEFATQGGAASNIAGVEALITGTFETIGDIQIINITGGDFLGRKFAVIERDDVDGYQAGSDILLELAGTSDTVLTSNIEAA